MLQKGVLFRAIGKIREIPKFQNVTLMNELNKDELLIHKEVQILYTEAASMPNVNAKMRGTKIEIDGNVYERSKFDSLPHRITRSTASTLVTEDAVVFQYLNDSVLQVVPSFNYLGIKLDSKLNFEIYALECIRQVSHKIYMLTKIRPFINNTQALYLYKSKILPYFDYGDIFYNKTFSRTLLRLQKLQNRALKLCMGKDALYNTDLLHVEAKLPKLISRRISHVLNFAHHWLEISSIYV